MVYLNLINTNWVRSLIRRVIDIVNIAEHLDGFLFTHPSQKKLGTLGKKGDQRSRDQGWHRTDAGKQTPREVDGVCVVHDNPRDDGPGETLKST